MRRANLGTPDARRWKIEFGNRLRELRVNGGLSQEALADAAEVHRTYVGQVERGQQNISLVLIHQLARALDVPASSLLERSVTSSVEDQPRQT